MAKKPKSSRTSLTAEMSPQDMIMALSDNLIGVVTLLTDMVLDAEGMNGMLRLFKIDDLNMRGEQIWFGYKYWTGLDKAETDEEARACAARFWTGVHESDPAMIDYVNEHCPRPRGEEVMTGASYKRARR